MESIEEVLLFRQLLDGLKPYLKAKTFDKINSAIVKKLYQLGYFNDLKAPLLEAIKKEIE